MLVEYSPMVNTTMATVTGCWVDSHFARKNSPEMLRASHRTTTIFWPLSSCLATMLAKRPRRCPLPSITIWKIELVKTVNCGYVGETAKGRINQKWKGRTYDGLEGRHLSRFLSEGAGNFGVGCVA